MQAALKIGANGYVQLAKGSAVATKDVASALLGLATGSDEDRAFFPSVRSRRIRGLNAVTADEVRATFGNAAPVSASDLLRLAGDTQSQSAAAVQGAVEGVTEAVAEAVEVLEGAMGAAIDTAITGATGVVSGSQTDESPAPDAAPAKPRRTQGYGEAACRTASCREALSRQGSGTGEADGQRGAPRRQGQAYSGSREARCRDPAGCSAHNRRGDQRGRPDRPGVAGLLSSSGSV